MRHSATIITLNAIIVTATAELLVAAGDNTDRIRSEAAFAKLCGVCPIPAGSGRTTGRHRLNRGGNAKPTPPSTES